jgi:hypothetical protein
VAVSGEVACEGRQQVLDWLSATPRDQHQVSALEFIANDTHGVLCIANTALQELAGVKLDGQLSVVFTIRDGQIAHIDDHAHRAQALAEAGIADHRWR